MVEILAYYSFITALLYCVIGVMGNPRRGLSIVNPVVIYDAISVNYFGAFVVALIHSICVGPLLTAGYWFYKLCVIGRK